MDKFITALTHFSAYELKVLLNEIHEDSEESLKGFFQSIKSLPEESYSVVYKKLDETFQTSWLEKQFGETVLPDENSLKEIMIKMNAFIDKIPAKIAEMEKNTSMAKQQTLEFREVMKAGWKLSVKTDQAAGIVIPPLQKTVEEGQEVISLPEFDESILKNNNIFNCIKNRISRRKYTEEKLTLNELAFLLWSTQGVQERLFDGKMTKRTVPSGGSRHPFETYLVVNHVEGLKEGIYRYQVLENELVYLFDVDNRKNVVGEAAFGQKFVGECAVTFI